LVATQLAFPIIDDLGLLSRNLRRHLDKIIGEAQNSRKIGREVLEGIILRLCSNHFITIRCLAELLARKLKTLRDQYLTRLVRSRKLVLAFPTAPSHERQAYHTAPEPAA